MIKFDPKTHIFTTTDGRQIPSVTQILKAEGWIDDRYYNEDSRKRGQYVHEATALLDAGQLDWTSLDDETAQYLLVYEKAKADLGIRTRGIEKIVHAGDQWAGICDRTLHCRSRSRLGLADLKTGGHETWHYMQLAGYWSTFKPRLRWGMILYLSKTDYRPEIYDLDEFDPWLMGWHHCVSQYHFKRMAWKR